MKRRDGLTRCRYRGFNGMQCWVGWGVIINNLWVLITAEGTPPKHFAKNTTAQLKPSQKFRTGN
jgi:hypothetical protein